MGRFNLLHGKEGYYFTQSNIISRGWMAYNQRYYVLIGRPTGLAYLITAAGNGRVE
jgi:hypothetical protein